MLDCPLLNWIISIAKAASKKIGALIHSVKFLSSEAALCLYKSTICPCMEYYCHIWAVAPSCYLQEYAGLLVFHLLLLLNTWHNVEMWPD